MIGLELPFVKLISDNSDWALDVEREELKSIEAGLPVQFSRGSFLRKSSLSFFLSRYKFLSDRYMRNTRSRNNLLNYFHGDPAVSPSASVMLSHLAERRSALAGVRVSHSGMWNLLAERGFEQVLTTIPISVSELFFREPSPFARSDIRKELGIPESIVLIGSFQKDGNGWKEGLAPKLEKGPDIFLEVIRVLKDSVPELGVLTSGPARGYLHNGLQALGIPFFHVGFIDWQSLPKLYQALDIYLVASRDEGGPKAVLEALAGRIPVVSAPVGQAIDFPTGTPGITVCQSHDAGQLADAVLRRIDTIEEELVQARVFAQGFLSIEQQPLWADFFERGLALSR